MKTNRRGFFATIAAAIAAPVVARLLPKPTPAQALRAAVENDAGLLIHRGNTITVKIPVRYMGLKPTEFVSAPEQFGQPFKFHKDAFVLETPRLTDEQITPYFEGMREQWERGADNFDRWTAQQYGDRWTAQQYSEIVEQAELYTDSMVRKSYVRIEG